MIKVAVRHGMSSQHLWTAQHNVELCKQREAEIVGKRPFDMTHRSYAIGSVLSSVAFLEAFINEIFGDCVENINSKEDARLPKLTKRQRVSMANWWTNGGDWKRVLAKFQKALKLGKRSKFDEANDPLYTNAQLLIELRNNLVHFKLDWYEVGVDSEFDARLAARIKPSPLVASTDAVPWFPVKALGSPGAEWAVASARAFADEWVSRMDSWRTYEVDFAHWQALENGLTGHVTD